MDKFILCLANSYKHGGRCIAGVEVSINDGKLAIKKSSYGIPVWIRPVSHSAAGEVPLSDALGIKVLSVVKVCNAQYAGNASHSEDHYYSKLELLDTLNPSDNFLNAFTDTWHNYIFGNRGRALTPQDFQSGDYSLMLIRTEGCEVYLDTRYTPKPRIKFQYSGAVYDFPITDPDFLNKLQANPTLYKSGYGTVYIVASLGVVHDGWHSKLAATIIFPAENNVKECISLNNSQRTTRPVLSSTQASVAAPTFPPRPRIEVPKTEVHLPNPSVINPRPASTNSYTRSTNFESVSKPTIKPQQNSNNGGCYVATAIYGSYDCPEVWTLRRYRDYTLAKSWYGRVFVYTYYAISPTLVKWFGHKLFFQKLCKEPLDKLVRSLHSKGYQNTPYKDKVW